MNKILESRQEIKNYICSMSLLKKLFQFYIHGNIHVAISTVCLVLVTGFLYDVSVVKTALFVGLSTFLSYNFIRYKKFKKKALNFEVLNWFYKNQKILFILSCFSFLGVLYFLFGLQLKSIVTMFPFALITLLYMLPVFRGRHQKKSLRALPRFKIFSIAVSWSGMVVFFPLVEANLVIGVEEILFFVHQLVFVLVLTLPFDIRDLDFDSEALKTIPQQLGIAKTKIVGVSLLVFTLLIDVYLFYPFEICVSFAIFSFLGLLLIFSKRKQSQYYASFWVEAIPMIWYVFLLLLEF